MDINGHSGHYWWCHLGWWWNVGNLSTELGDQKITENIHVSYKPHRYSDPLTLLPLVFRSCPIFDRNWNLLSSDNIKCISVTIFVASVFKRSWWLCGCLPSAGYVHPWTLLTVGETQAFLFIPCAVFLTVMTYLCSIIFFRNCTSFL